MEKEILKILKKSWKEFVDARKEDDDWRDDDEYSFGEFIEWIKG